MKKKLGTKSLLRKSFVLIQKLQLDAKLGTPTNRAIYNYVLHSFRLLLKAKRVKAKLNSVAICYSLTGNGLQSF